MCTAVLLLQDPQRDAVVKEELKQKLIKMEIPISFPSMGMAWSPGLSVDIQESCFGVLLLLKVPLPPQSDACCSLAVPLFYKL